MDKVSVIVPVYNADKYIDGCIESIVNQSYKNIEIILVDDGSTDQSAKKLDDWAKKDQRIKAVHKENGGVSSSRNVGLDNAIGEFVMFVDSDDTVTNDFVETALFELKERDLDVLSFAFDFVYDENYCVSACDKISLFVDFANKKNLVEFLLRYISKGEFSYCVWNRIYKRSIIEERSLRFDVDKSLGEDFLFVLKYLCYAKNFASTSKILYRYTFGVDNSLTESWNKSLDYKIKEANEIANEFIKELNRSRKFEDCKEIFALIYVAIMQVYIGKIIGDNKKSKLYKNLKKIGNKELIFENFKIVNAKWNSYKESYDFSLNDKFAYHVRCVLASKNFVVRAKWRLLETFCKIKMFFRRVYHKLKRVVNR